MKLTRQACLRLSLPEQGYPRYPTRRHPPQAKPGPCSGGWAAFNYQKTSHFVFA